MEEPKKYQTILADPPYNEVGGGRIKRGAQRHYPLMKTKDIIEFMKQVPVADNAHLYLWVTNNFLEDGLEVMKSMNFRYVTNLAWVKDRFGLGQYFRGQHELLLFGVKGKVPYKRDVVNGKRSCIPTVHIEARQEHSRKPAYYYDVIEKTSYGPYVEVFARNTRSGWDSIGNEVGKFDSP